MNLGDISVSKRPSLSDDVYERLKALIMDFQVPPSSRINMDVLARQLDVSITPIREALSRLESDGLVVKQSMRGYTAAPVISLKEFEDLYGLRLRLEPWCAAEATLRADADDIAALDVELATAYPVPQGESYDTYRAFVNHDDRFHAMIHALAGNAVIASALARTHAHLHLFRLNYAGASGAASLIEHAALLDAMRAGDAVAAEAAMTVHLESARARLRAVFTA